MTSPTPAPPILRATGLRRAFGGVVALDGLDLTLDAGKIYGFLGGNGAGKTTALRVIMGIVKPDAGALELFGERTRAPTLRQKRAIGFVSQEQHFYGWMTGSSLGRFVSAFYPGWDAAEYARLLEVLDVPPGRRVSALSVGMRRKLGLALALAHRPRLLLLDEPTAGLDPMGRREFLDLVRQQARDYDRTTLFSTHRIDEAEEFADTIGIIDAGRMCFEGSLTSLRQTVRAVPEDQAEAALAAGLERLPGCAPGGQPVFRGAPELWAAVPGEAMDLERIFIAMVWKDRARL